MRVGELLRPLSRAMAEELLGGDYLQADETPVGVQMHDGRGQNHQAYLWQYSRPGGAVIFDFQLSRAREGPKQFLGNFNGIFQTDGYSGYDRVGGPKLIHAGCCAHAHLIPVNCYSILLARLQGEPFGANASFAETREELNQAVQMSPEDAKLLSNLAVVDALLGRKRDAIGEAKHAIEMRPPSRDALAVPGIVAKLVL